MKLHTSDTDTYEFPNFAAVDPHAPQFISTVYALCDNAGVTEIWQVVGSPTKAAGQLVAFYKLTGNDLRWIRFVSNCGFHNPTGGEYADQNPDVYKAEN